MAKGGWMPPLNRFFQFFSGMGRAFLQTKFLAVGESLVHLCMRKFFQIAPTVLVLKLDNGRVLGGWQPLHLNWAKVDLCFNHEDDI